MQVILHNIRIELRYKKVHVIDEQLHAQFYVTSSIRDYLFNRVLSMKQNYHGYNQYAIKVWCNPDSHRQQVLN